MTVEIRRAGLDDLDALIVLKRDVHALHVAARPDQFKPTESAQIEERLRELLAAPDAKIWVALLAGEIVGYSVSIFMRRPEHFLVPARHYCEIDQIGVIAMHRRRGVGSALLQTAVDDARNSGIQEIELSSWAFNHDAHRAFERFGFIPKVIRFELER